MKYLSSALVLACICSMLVGASYATAHEMEAAEARHVLIHHKPLIDPAFELVVPDAKERRSARNLFAAQIKAIHALAGSKDVSLIPVLIPYLDYTDDAAPRTILRYRNDGPLPDIETIAADYPAFAVIIRMPTASTALSSYVTDSKNLINHRATAFHVLRYVDKRRFDALRPSFDKEFSHAGPQTKSCLKAVEQENAPFEGIDSIDMAQ